MNKDQKATDLKNLEEDVANVAKVLPDHTKKEFTFSALEQQLLAEQQTIIALAQGAQNTLINEIVLKRVGITPGPDVHIRYSIGLGRFVAFTPKTKK